MKSNSFFFSLKNLLFFSLIVSQSFAEAFNSDSLFLKSVNAVYTNQTIIIDGVIDEDIWAKVESSSQFFQTSPNELVEPSEETYIKILYDKKNLYVAFICKDKFPQKIKKMLTRRDDWNGFSNNSDWVRIGIDSKNNNIDASFFAVNSSGIKADAKCKDHEEYDLSWNAVWDASTFQDSKGWSAEYRIPFSILQFENEKKMEWGIFFARYLHRTQEDIEWPGRKKSFQGTSRSFGKVLDIANIPSPKKLELVPYLLSGKNDNSYKLNKGIDIRYGINSNSIAQFTFNPDFGQIEADPSILNLTAFETELEEKRPFFTEGSEFFNNNINLFHSRRIGGSPGFNIPDSGEIINIAENTKIIGAVKLIGNIKNKFNYSIINAKTEKVEADLAPNSLDSNLIYKIEVEPKTNYSIARLEYAINSTSRFGVMGTNVDRNNSQGAKASGIDWKLGIIDNRLVSSGQLLKSDKNNIKGEAFRFNIVYTSKTFWNIRLWHGVINKNFNINDLGYLERNNIIWSGGKITFGIQNPWKIFLENDLEFKYKEKKNIDGLLLEKYIELEQKIVFKNYWNLKFIAENNMPAYSDNDLFRDENAWLYKTENFSFIGLGLDTDRRKNIIISFFGGVGSARKRGKGYYFDYGIDMKPFKNINININISEDSSPNYMQWVDVIEKNEYLYRVYANTETLTKKIELRFNWTVSPDISFEGFYQPFNVTMDYNNYFSLNKEKTMDLNSFPYGDDLSFKINNSVGTFVLRYEYRPGSTIFIVYNINQNNYYDTSTNTWNKNNENAMYLKINYWFKN